ncbi:hypothetical protein ACOMHN_026392 [Nucella lapillus]
MLMMRARVQGHRWVDHPAAAVMEARVPGQWVDRPAAVVMEAREQGRCWIDHPAAAVMEAWECPTSMVAELEADLPLAQVQEVGLVTWSLVLGEGRSQNLHQSLSQTLAAPVDAVEVVVVPGQEQSVEG